MRWLFWSSVGVIGYTYFGYPAWLWLRSRWKSAPIRRAPFLPSISIVMVVRNEATVLERKLRTLTGNCQLLQLEPWLLTGKNPIRFEFISHKLCWLLVPFMLATTLVTSAMLPGTFFRVVLFLQAGFYAFAMWSNEQPGRNVFARGADAAFTFVLLNVAALVAFGKFVSGRKPVWTR